MAIVELKTWKIMCDFCRKSYIENSVLIPNYPPDWEMYNQRHEYGQQLYWLCSDCASKQRDQKNGI